MTNALQRLQTLADSGTRVDIQILKYEFQDKFTVTLTGSDHESGIALKVQAIDGLSNAIHSVMDKYERAVGNGLPQLNPMMIEHHAVELQPPLEGRTGTDLDDDHTPF